MMKLPKHKYLLTYRYAEVVHDLNEEFCRQFLPGRENLRLREQMCSADRYNKQNIVKKVNQKTSLKGQIKLLGVAQASTEELVADYEDFLRQRKLLVWEKSQPEVNFYRQLGWEATSCYPPKLLKLLKELRREPEEAGNLMLP
jgi:hypothetical protein